MNKNMAKSSIETIEGIDNLICCNVQILCFAQTLGDQILAKIQEFGVKPTGCDAPKPAWTNGAGKIDIAVTEDQKKSMAFMG